MEQDPPIAEPFQLLTMDEFDRLSTDERAAYLRRAMESLGLIGKRRKPDPQPS
jgi:hypothetical protein